MIAERIFKVKTLLDGYVVLCDDGEHHRTTRSLRVLSGVLIKDYVPSRIGRGADDITDTPEGRAFLATVNAQLQK